MLQQAAKGKKSKGKGPDEEGRVSTTSVSSGVKLENVSPSCRPAMLQCLIGRLTSVQVLGAAQSRSHKESSTLLCRVKLHSDFTL